MLLKVVLTFEFVEEIRKCDRFSETHRILLSCVVIFILCKVVLTFECVDEIINREYKDHFNEDTEAFFLIGLNE